MLFTRDTYAVYEFGVAETDHQCSTAGIKLSFALALDPFTG